MRRALVTGGSGGIGAAICRRLASAGIEVWVHGHRNVVAAQALAQEISGHAIAFDVCDIDAARSAIEPLVEDKPLDIVVHAAGIHDDAAFPGMRAEQWSRVIDVSLNGFYNVTRPLVMPMVRARWGRIVSITSVAAQIGNRGQVNYAAAKGALHSATRALSLELASRGITVNAVAPGIITTAMSAETFDRAAIER